MSFGEVVKVVGKSVFGIVKGALGDAEKSMPQFSSQVQR